MVAMAVAGNLIVQVVAARIVMSEDTGCIGARTGVYCVLYYDGRRETTSASKPMDLDVPTWNEKFEFLKHDIRDQSKDLEINISYEYRWKTFSGKVVIHTNAVPERPANVRWYPLQKRDEFSPIEGDLGLRIWLQTAKPNVHYRQPDLDEPSSATNMLESIESEIETILKERMVARAAHLEKMKDLGNANHSRVAEAFEYSCHTEWSIQEASPLRGSQLVAQSLQRTQSMLASKQTLETFHIPLHLIPRIENAMDNERQLVKIVTKAARDAGEQQKQLSDMEQTSYQAHLALIEIQTKERTELFKASQQEKDQRLSLWAASRRDTLDVVRSIERASQLLVERLNTLVETTRKLKAKWEAEMLRVLGGEAVEETSSSCQRECQICFDYVEGPSSGTSKTRDLKQRSCLVPCNHAMICLPCATEIWESTKSCPFCKVGLTTKPCALYLG